MDFETIRAFFIKVIQKKKNKNHIAQPTISFLCGENFVT